MQGPSLPSGLDLRDPAKGGKDKLQGKLRPAWGGAWARAKERGFYPKNQSSQASPSLNNHQVCLLNMDSSNQLLKTPTQKVQGWVLGSLGAQVSLKVRHVSDALPRAQEAGRGFGAEQYFAELTLSRCN